jgi:preprotein translocase subunit SecE
MAQTGLLEYFRQVRSEIKKITWPTRKETTASVIAVMIMVILCAIFLYLADQVISYAIRLIMGIGL